MSYSFGVRAASIAALIAAAGAKMGEIVTQQPIHKADEQVPIKALQGAADAVGEPPEGKVLSASVSGWCSAVMEPDGSAARQLLQTSVSVSVGFADKAEGE
jgi:hypothetical protein